MYEVLDLAVHWLTTAHEIDKEQRELIDSEWNGPLSDVVRELPPEDAWAPSWWTGDEDAARSALVAAANLGRGR